MVNIFRYISIALIFIAISGCAGRGREAAVVSEVPDIVTMGTITMTQEGVILITFAGIGKIKPPPPLTIRRSEHPDAFDSYVELAEEIAVGETKNLIPYTALVEMNGDRSITVSWADGFRHDGIVQEPHVERILPGSSRYDEIVAKVSGIAPGKTIGFRVRTH